MGALGSLQVEEIIRSGSIRDVDVLRLRSALQGDGIASADEAELLFRLNEACPLQHPAWADFFVETLTDYVVDQSEPEGYLTTDDAKRLVDRVTSGGRVAPQGRAGSRRQRARQVALVAGQSVPLCAGAG